MELWCNGVTGNQTENAGNRSPSFLLRADNLSEYRRRSFLLFTGSVVLQRAQALDDGTWIKDPSPDASQAVNFSDLMAYFQEQHPELVPDLITAWEKLTAVVGSINQKLQLV